ncbi:MAG: type VI secretion system tube protein Hcp [bacterium]|nr:type VI secretion system tube protein Hcp [bacterium]
MIVPQRWTCPATSTLIGCRAAIHVHAIRDQAIPHIRPPRPAAHCDHPTSLETTRASRSDPRPAFVLPSPSWHFRAGAGRHEDCHEGADANGNPIAGESTIPGFAGWIDASSLQHSVIVPIGANGQPSGAAQPSAVFLSAAWDLATVRLFQSQANGTPFQSVTVELIDDPTAKMPMALTRLVLANANIQSISYGFVEVAGYFDVSMALSFSQVNITDFVAGNTAT